VNHDHARLRAIEVNAKENLSGRDLQGLRALQEERLLKRYVLVSLERVPPRVEGFEILPLARLSGPFVGRGILVTYRSTV
jgi:hypothetical protein